MPSTILLLRGINLGASNRIAMPALRAALSEAGYENARTYLQSGNIAVSSGLDVPALAERVEGLITERFGLAVPVVARSASELARVVAENPFPQAAELAPKRYQVTFFSEAIADEVAARVRTLPSGPFAPDSEAISLAISNRNAYGWHPDGIHSSKLARELSDRRLGVTATARNWTTVLALLEMATSDAG